MGRPSRVNGSVLSDSVANMISSESTERVEVLKELSKVHGVGEVTQAFCRLCAVYGGVYILRRNPSAFLADAGSECTGVALGSKRVAASGGVERSAEWTVEWTEATQVQKWTRSAPVRFISGSLRIGWSSWRPKWMSRMPCGV